MAKRRDLSSATPPEYCFVKQLDGEAPPSFSAMRRLYEISARVGQQLPWKLLGDSELILYSDPATGEMCHCSVMGALGEVFSVHVYRGDEGFRAFDRIAKDDLRDPREFFAISRGVSVEWVTRRELDKPDRELLGWLGHPSTRGIGSPVFRAIRPGFFPWYITADEAELLAGCLEAVFTVCSALQKPEALDLWSLEGIYPLVQFSTSGAAQIVMVMAKPSAAEPFRPASVDAQELSQVRRNDYPIHGVTELDYFFSGGPIGQSNERKACGCLGLAADSASGFVFPPNLVVGAVPVFDVLAQTFVKSIKSSRMLPQELRVRTPEAKAALAPLAESLGVAIHASRKLPSLDRAHAALLEFLSR